jgi:putative transposase
VKKTDVVNTIETLKHRYRITELISVFGVPKATYYRWKKKVSLPPTELQLLIQQLCKNSYFRYGHRKITALLNRKHNQKVNRKTVQKVMQENNLQCRVKVKRQNFINGESKIVVPHLLQRNFKANQPNEKWVTDITYLPFGQSMLYLSTIMDLYNNEIIAYDISDRQDVDLVLKTLEKAVSIKQPKNVILHSDQGSVYTSYVYHKTAKEKGITRSMSRKGNCHDNAVIESFHSSLKSEEFASDNRGYLTNIMIIQKVENYMRFYNEERIQEKLNYLTPYEYGSQVA